MKSKGNKRNNFAIKLISYSSVILNSFCVVLGIIYLLIPIYLILWDIFGIILLITLFQNIILSYFSSIRINKTSKLGKRINLFCYIHLLFTIIAMVGMLGGNLLFASPYDNTLGAYIMISSFYFGLMIFSIFIALIDIKNLNNAYLWDFTMKFKTRESERSYKIKKLLTRILIIFSWTLFVIGALFALVIVFGSFEIISTMIAIICAQFGIFFSIIFFANTLILLMLKKKRWSPKKCYRIAIIGFFVSGFLMMPLFITNFTIYNAEKNFTDTFGQNWRDKIPASANKYFLKTPFSIPGYFLGIPPKKCILERDILFYNDEGISLYFDAYLPPNGGLGLPGENSTIIRIHGGGWVSGDKGFMNMMQMNKYFAAQGYVVFDIQYGIYDNPFFKTDPLTPDYKKGDFNIDDMMRHIGIFTNYLVEHAGKYGANLDSVFISGGSAGGHLTCAAALAMAGGDFTDLFSQNLTVKGLIPFYPANGQMMYFGIDGREEFKNPEMLIKNDSPPCLIFQGTHDILNYFSISENIRNTYLAKGNTDCAILWMPLGGHACDFYFPGYYNQIFLYYMERFMYLYH